MKKPCSRKTFELVVLAALKHHEISEGRAVELLGWKRDKIRDQQALRVGKIAPASLAEALEIMDLKARRNPEDNSKMLLDKDWEQLRAILLDTLETERDHRLKSRWEPES